MAQLTSNPTIPIIDFAPFVTGIPIVQQEIAEQISRACREVGFFYLCNHNIPQSLIDLVFEQMQALFALPFEKKSQFAWSDEVSNRGYVGIERERLDPSQPGDLKEAFNLGKEEAIGQSALTMHRGLEDLEGFQPVLLQFWQACSEEMLRILQAFAIALSLPKDFFTPLHDEYDNILRLLHYPPLTQFLKPGQIRAGAHSDYGSLTLLFQDEIGGLEVQTVGGEWIDAVPIPGTLLVNIGDLMQRWTNDNFRSTLHRVGVPPTEKQSQHRYSIAYFCHPNPKSAIACLPSCQSGQHPPQYPPILAGDYLLSRLQATY
ncbi:MAG: isopenicillin N synthase family oxygenase [Desertifilum sp. SIO1I2]|nr:isopenicillin N synthase family oxygenase [Desertifilum sp. SIO1I2]